MFSAFLHSDKYKLALGIIDTFFLLVERSDFQFLNASSPSGFNHLVPYPTISVISGFMEIFSKCDL